ncbi:exopolysaccharide production protein ExoZ [Rhodoferax ferrireducens]|uniref:Exopolysaccharide production protein ExoZ n=1 Tax=Rhodoferax ferrireducens TaxID=192843 RepID=A0ABU2C6C9_9BURK|nr:acyltransferase [Rhodoferax ferrireducens]MDR7376900.1 exopolysaccharide production protein ExoZ [Rhodoferax ferrireducens]
MTIKIENKELVNIQYLRAIAALMVVWVHAREQFPWVRGQFPSGVGANGVDLFFVISGFIMVYTTHNKSISPLAFMVRRLERIAPLYWLATLLIVLVASVVPLILKSTVLSSSHIFASLAFVPMLSPAFPDKYWPLLIPGWTLNYEMAFYAIFSITLFVKGLYRIFLLSFVLLSLVVAGLFFNWQGVLGFYADAIILIFLAGAILGYFYVKGRLKKNALVGIFFVLLGVGLWIVTQDLDVGHRAIGAGIPATLVVLGFCCMPTLFPDKLTWLARLGDASFSIYLSHIFILAGLRTLLNRIGIVIAENSLGLTYMVLAIAICAIFGFFVYQWIEKPLSKIRFKRTGMRVYG